MSKIDKEICIGCNNQLQSEALEIEPELRRDWNDYLKTQKYAECQLVTALNIYYYFTNRMILPSSNLYEYLVDLCLARHGSAICIDKVYDVLGIKVIQTFNNDYRLEEANIPLPLGVSVYPYKEKFGFHSVAIIDYNEDIDCFRIPNWKGFTNEGWITRKEFNKYYILMRKDGFLGGKNPFPIIKYRLFGEKKV